jgi:hypothetical protein
VRASVTGTKPKRQSFHVLHTSSLLTTKCIDFPRPYLNEKTRNDLFLAHRRFSTLWPVFRLKAAIGVSLGCPQGPEREAKTLGAYFPSHLGGTLDWRPKPGVRPPATCLPDQFGRIQQSVDSPASARSRLPVVQEPPKRGRHTAAPRLGLCPEGRTESKPMGIWRKFAG